tara:strand:- start:195 stop:431 length:237 start_codon:yes stop_codon:yes gene_type:complete
MAPKDNQIHIRLDDDKNQLLKLAILVLNNYEKEKAGEESKKLGVRLPIKEYSPTETAKILLEHKLEEYRKFEIGASDG